MNEKYDPELFRMLAKELQAKKERPEAIGEILGISTEDVRKLLGVTRTGRKSTKTVAAPLPKNDEERRAMVNWYLAYRRDFGRSYYPKFAKHHGLDPGYMKTAIAYYKYIWETPAWDMDPENRAFRLRLNQERRDEEAARQVEGAKRYAEFQKVIDSYPKEVRVAEPPRPPAPRLSKDEAEYKRLIDEYEKAERVFGKGDAAGAAWLAGLREKYEAARVAPGGSCYAGPPAKSPRP